MPWLTYVVPIAQGNGDEARGKCGCCAFPKRKVWSIPSIVRWAGNGQFCPGRKSSIIHSILIGLASYLAGFTLVYILQYLYFFQYFFQTFLCAHILNGPMKWCLYKLNKIYWPILVDGTTRVDVQRKGMPGKVFPMAGYPPGTLLMGGWRWKEI